MVDTKNRRRNRQKRLSEDGTAIMVNAKRRGKKNKDEA